MDSGDLKAEIQKIIGSGVYSHIQTEKERFLLSLLIQEIQHAIENSDVIRHFFTKQRIHPEDIQSVTDVPFMPVQMFKYFDLRTCQGEDVVKILKSSGTTTGMQSRVPLDKTTIMNQIKALQTILASYLGSKRRIFLVIDHEGINNPALEFTARTAGVRGLSIYAKQIYYLLKEEANGNLILNLPVIQEIQEKYSDQEVYVFGFTFIIWTVFYQQMKEAGLVLKLNNPTVFHSGGWKKLKSQSVSKEYFNEHLAEILGCDIEHILDFYGMAEQTGIIFPDCPYGNKHVPVFADVIIRNPYTMHECEAGETGIIEVMSVLSTSYYCQAILTEDTGYIVGIDDCPCGRKGKYFRFASRIEKAEARGCGDTFREKKNV